MNSERAAGEYRHPLLAAAEARSWLCSICSTAVAPGETLYFVLPDSLCARHWPGLEALRTEFDDLFNQYARGVFKTGEAYRKRYEVLTAALDSVRGGIQRPQQERS